MSISRMSRARRLQRSVCSKSYNVQKWEIRFTLGFNTAKNNKVGHENLFNKIKAVS